MCAVEVLTECKESFSIHQQLCLTGGPGVVAPRPLHAVVPFASGNQHINLQHAAMMADHRIGINCRETALAHHGGFGLHKLIMDQFRTNATNQSKICGRCR